MSLDGNSLDGTHDAAPLTVDRLLGADQTWIDAARRALADQDSAFLSDEMIEALSYDTLRLRDGDDPMAWESVWESVAEPLNDLLADLAAGRETADSLSVLLATFDKHGLVSVRGEDKPRNPSARWTEADVRHQVTVLNAATSSHGSGPFAAILVHVLTANDTSRRRTTSVSMPVLLHNEANERVGRPPGEVGTLTLTAWREGPSGLHPDPRLMTFSTVDSDARQGLQQAMLGSPHASRGTCITWAVRDMNDSPVRRLEGQSLAAAVALLLRELSARRGVRAGVWRLRPRRLRSDWTVTAGLRGRHLTRVAHYETKLEAVASLAKPLHVAIAPRPDERHDRGDDPVLAVGGRLGLDVRVIETYEGLATATRTLNRGFVVGVVGAILLVAAFAGVTMKARQAVDAANLAADKRSAATELMQQARSMIDQDPRLAALTALAADDLDPSLRTAELMADVLAANTTVVGSAEVSSSYIRDVVVSHNTLVVFDGDDRVTAWSLPSFQQLGALVESGARGITASGPGDIAVLVDAQLRIYHTADGYLPLEVNRIETGLEVDGEIFGPYTNPTSGGVMVVDEDFNGAYFENGMARPFEFSVGDDPAIESDPRSSSVAIRTTSPNRLVQGDPPDGVTEVYAIGVATSSRQVIDIAIQKHYEDNPRWRAVVYPVMPASAARASIRAVASGPNDTVMLGTDRGLQQWDPTTYDTVEFPYGGWSDQVDGLYYDYGPIVVASKQKVGFFSEPIDDRPRESPTIVQLEGSVFTSLSSGDIGSDYVTQTRYFVGREDGTVTMLDPTDSTFGPGTLPGSNVQQFTPTGHVIRTAGETPQMSSYLETDAVPDDPADEANNSDEYDPYERTYALPETNGLYPYINDAAAAGRWVVAAGLRSDGLGAWWAWPLPGGSYAMPDEIPFGNGETGEDRIPDIVSDIGFVDGGREVVALNGAKGELGFWSVGDWKHVGSVPLEVPGDFDTAGAMRLVTAEDGRTVAVRDSDTTVQIIDVASHSVSRTVTVPDGSITDITLSPDGSRLAATDHLRTVKLIDVTVEPGTVLATREQPSVVNALAFDPSGTRLALGMATSSTVQILASDSLEPLGPPWATEDGYRVIDVAWSPNGNLLSVGTFQYEGERAVNGETHILDPTMLTWRQQLCRMATSNFSKNEWHQLSASDLPMPHSCEQNGEAPNPDAPAERTLPAQSGDLSRADLMAGAPVPPMCGHDAGTLILGHLPNQPPMTGDVYLGNSSFGDLTGDGVADAAVDLQCNAGGVAWPSTIAGYTRASDGTVELLGTISSDDAAVVGPEGSERPVVVSVGVEAGMMTADVIANTEGDPACCGTLPVHLTLSVGEGGLQVASADRRYDLVVMNKLVDGIKAAAATGIDYSDSTDTPTAVVGAIADMNAAFVGVEVGQCAKRESLSDELALRVSEDNTSYPDAPTHYCTVVAAPEEDAEPLLLRLTQVDDEHWRVIDLIP